MCVRIRLTNILTCFGEAQEKKFPIFGAARFSCEAKKKGQADSPSNFFLESRKINYEAVAEMKAEAPCDLKVAFDWMHYKGEK